MVGIPEPRGGLAAVPRDEDRVLVIGGYNRLEVLKTTNIYSMLTNEWTDGPTLNS